MKRTIFFLVLVSTCAFSQKNTKLINPKGRWYFGLEIGKNEITSFNNGEGNISLSIGAMSEYYFDKHWSIQARMKYIKTGVSFEKKPDNDWNFGWIKSNQANQDVSYNPYYNRFDGQTLVFPIDLKWEFRIHKNFRGNFKLGPAANIELKSTYQYANADYTRNKPMYVNMNFGYGVNYYISKKLAVALDYESFFWGDSKGSTPGFLWNKTYYATNSILNLQLKCSL
jgi:hypothetical protein